jgi:DNA-binding transcriptional MerR regulator
MYFKIREVKELTGLDTHVLRFWETEFKKIKPKRTESGQRLYRKKDIEIIFKIKTLLYEKKFTIKGAKKIININSPEPEDTKPLFIKELIQELTEIKNLLE